MRHPYEWVVSFLTRKPVFVQWSLTWPRRKVRTVSARTQFFRARSVISSYWSGQTGFFSNLFLLDFFEVFFFSWFFNCGTFQTINKFCIQAIYDFLFSYSKTWHDLRDLLWVKWWLHFKVEPRTHLQKFNPQAIFSRKIFPSNQKRLNNNDLCFYDAEKFLKCQIFTQKYF